MRISDWLFCCLIFGGFLLKFVQNVEKKPKINSIKCEINCGKSLENNSECTVIKLRKFFKYKYNYF